MLLMFAYLCWTKHVAPIFMLSLGCGSLIFCHWVESLYHFLQRSRFCIASLAMYMSFI